MTLQQFLETELSEEDEKVLLSELQEQRLNGKQFLDMVADEIGSYQERYEKYFCFEFDQADEDREFSFLASFDPNAEVGKRWEANIDYYSSFNYNDWHDTNCGQEIIDGNHYVGDDIFGWLDEIGLF
jgi:hypothetical protein